MIFSGSNIFHEFIKTICEYYLLWHSHKGTRLRITFYIKIEYDDKPQDLELGSWKLL